jgi:hypothetical protein
LPSATDRPVLLSDGDFHPTLGAYSQAHFPRPFAPNRFQIRQVELTEEEIWTIRKAVDQMKL